MVRVVSVVRGIARGVLAATCAAALSMTACSHSPAQMRTFAGVPLMPNITCNDAACRSYKEEPYVLTRSRYGIGCLGNVPPGTTPRSKPPPQSYRVNDIGKTGFPALKRSEASMVRRIVRYVHSNTLRIAWVSDPREFIVFDAKDGPCETWAPGYVVLNADSCNEYYEPGENPYETHAGPGCSFGVKRPWIVAARRGKG
jgi:hypothetical protein